MVCQASFVTEKSLIPTHANIQCLVCGNCGRLKVTEENHQMLKQSSLTHFFEWDWFLHPGELSLNHSHPPLRQLPQRCCLSVQQQACCCFDCLAPLEHSSSSVRNQMCQTQSPKQPLHCACQMSHSSSGVRQNLPRS